MESVKSSWKKILRPNNLRFLSRTGIVISDRDNVPLEIMADWEIG